MLLPRLELDKEEAEVVGEALRDEELVPKTGQAHEVDAFWEAEDVAVEARAGKLDPKTLDAGIHVHALGRRLAWR
jgi:hypothetical protein